MHVVKDTPAGEEIATCMVHLHQHRGNVWLRQMGWITLFPTSDPAPAWRSAVAGLNVDLSDMGLPQFRHIVRDCRNVAEESVQNVRECHRDRACMYMFCRLLMTDAGEDTLTTALRAGSDAAAASVERDARALMFMTLAFVPNA